MEKDFEHCGHCGYGAVAAKRVWDIQSYMDCSTDSPLMNHGLTILDIVMAILIADAIMWFLRWVLHRIAWHRAINIQQKAVLAAQAQYTTDREFETMAKGRPS